MKTIDLGLGHSLRFTVWKPDRALNPQYDGIPDGDPIGAVVEHVKADGSTCKGSILFDCDAARMAFAGQDRWTVEQWDPLTLSPSLLCACGDHGFVREGKWVPA